MLEERFSLLCAPGRRPAAPEDAPRGREIISFDLPITRVIDSVPFTARPARDNRVSLVSYF
jgi:hypothetical protein